ncbi:MAG: MFS transporter [Myxococcota bacterium]
MRWIARLLGIDPGVVALGSARMLDALGNSFVILVLTRTVDDVAAPLVHLPRNTRLGLVISLFGLALALAQPLVGRFADRQRVLRPVILFGLVSFTLLSAALSFATAYWQVLLLRAGQGLALSATVPTSLAVISRLTTPERRGTAMGFYGMVRLTGFALGPLAAGAVLAVASPSDAYLVAAVPAVISVGLVAVFLPAEATRNAPEPEPGDAGEPPPDLPPRGPFLLLGSVFFVVASCLSLLAALEEEYTTRLGIDAFEFGVAFSSLIAARLVMDIPVGRASDLFGRKGLIILGLLLLGPTTLMTALSDSLGDLVLWRLGMGVATSFLTAPTFALAADLLRGHRGTGRMSLVTAGFGLGLAIGPLLAAVMADVITFTAPFLLYMGLCVVLAAVIHRVVPSRRR